MNIQQIFATIGICGLIVAGLLSEDWRTKFIGVLLGIVNTLIFIK